MFLSLKGALGRNPMINRVGQRLLQAFEGASAAYSLRDLASNIASVVRVRRASDNSEKDFSASDVSSGAMTSWVNAQVVPPLDVRELVDGERTGDLVEAAAAYSLRNLSSTYTGDVVDVRRSSDDAEEPFTASEVADGTLTDWVNTDVSIYQSDFSSDSNGWGGSTSSPVGNQDGVSDGTTSKDNVLKLTKNQDSQAYAQRNQGVVAGLTYTVSGSFYAPSSNSAVDSILIKDGNAGNSLSSYPSGYLISNGVWTDFSFTYTATTTGTQRLNIGVSSLGNNANGSSSGSTGDVVYISDLQFVETTSNGFVSQWYDQSGNNNHATQGTDASQPKIVDGGVLVSGGIDFDGVDDELKAASFSASQPITSFSVFTQDSVSSTIYGSGGGHVLITSSTNKISLNTGTALVSSASISLGTQALVSALANSTSSFTYINGGNTTTGDAGTTGIASPLRLGNTSSGRFTNGKIQEIIIYNSDQSDNRTAFEANIGETYGIDLPSGVDTGYDQVDGFVETWYDQSGNGSDAVQEVAGSQPKIVDAGSLVSGGLEFDGVDDYLGTSTFSLAQPYTTLSVSKSFIDNASSGLLAVAASPNGAPSLNSFYRADNGFAINAGVTLTTAPSTTYSTNTSYLKTSLFNGASSDISVNGISQGFGNAGSFDASGYLYLGNFSGNHLNGTISEIIIYNSDQSNNRLAIEANINNQYDIY